MTEKLQIYKCEICGNIIQVMHEGADALVCCREEMKLLPIQHDMTELGEKHTPKFEESESNRIVSVAGHPMTEEHYIEFIQVYTKDKNLPSLSHTYQGTTSPNQKIIIEIEPKNVINLIEIIKLIFKRKTFYDLFEIYINNVIIQRYTIGFTYLTAIIKQYSFRAIEEYSNYKTYYLAFFQLFRPFLKKMFRYFINCFFKNVK